MAGQAPLAPSRAHLLDCFVARKRSDYEYLVLRRAPGKLYAGTWRMVAGKLDPGETAHAACLRELAEETGLEPEQLLVVPFLNGFYDWRADRMQHIPVFLALVSATAAVQLDDEHDDFRWCSLHEASALLDWPGQRRGLEAAAELLSAGARLPPELVVELPPR